MNDYDVLASSYALVRRLAALQLGGNASDYRCLRSEARDLVDRSLPPFASGPPPDRDVLERIAPEMKDLVRSLADLQPDASAWLHLGLHACATELIGRMAQ